MNDINMLRKLYRALKQGGDLYTLNDLIAALKLGTMQGHINGQTWAVTKVHDWPHRRTVEIVYVIGNLEEALAMEERLTEWSKEIGADRITAVGRDGWWPFKTPGWNKVGTLYAKDI